MTGTVKALRPLPVLSSLVCQAVTLTPRLSGSGAGWGGVGQGGFPSGKASIGPVLSPWFSTVLQSSERFPRCAAHRASRLRSAARSGLWGAEWKGPPPTRGLKHAGRFLGREGSEDQAVCLLPSCPVRETHTYPVPSHVRSSQVLQVHSCVLSSRSCGMELWVGTRSQVLVPSSECWCVCLGRGGGQRGRSCCPQEGRGTSTASNASRWRSGSSIVGTRR